MAKGMDRKKDQKKIGKSLKEKRAAKREKRNNQMSYLFLAGAIIFEVVGTLLLPICNNFTKPLPSLALIFFYLVSFYLLTFAVKDIPIAIVYSIWSGVGIFLITILSYFFFSQVWKTLSLVCKHEQNL